MAKLILKVGKRYVRRDMTITKPLVVCGSMLKDSALDYVYNKRNKRFAYVYDRTNPHRCDLIAEYVELEKITLDTTD